MAVSVDPTQGMTFANIFDWALRIVLLAISGVVYLLERDHKLRAEAIATKFRQQTKDLETLRADMHERFERAGKLSSDAANRTQAQMEKLDVRIDHEHGKRRMDVDALNANLGRLQVEQARQSVEIKNLERRREPREHGDVT